MATDTPRVNFATYPQDYYTGSQTRVYFGGVYVDDIATIQYQSRHPKTPLYGYNDHQFRAIAKGQFIVEGNFTVAFKETGYLNVIMNLIKDQNSGILQLAKEQNPDSTQTFLRYIQQGMTPEEAVDLAASKGRSAIGGGNKDTQDFEDIAEVMEDTLWGKEGSVGVHGPRIPRSDELDYRKYTTGVVNKNFEKDIDKDGFDILLTFGDYRTGSDAPEHTMISINDVHITGEALIATPSAEPIGISYTFFARGLNEKVSQSWTPIDKKQAENPATESDVSQEVTDAVDNKPNDIVELINEILEEMDGLA